MQVELRLIALLAIRVVTWFAGATGSGAIERLWAEKADRLARGGPARRQTCLCRSLPDTRYFDCELPSCRRVLPTQSGSSAKSGPGGW